MKHLIFIVAVEKLAIGALLVVALDVRLHHRFEMLGGVNLKGYRGQVMPAKRPDELRIAVVGGSFAFGWGVAAPETFSGYLGRLVTERFRTRSSPPTRATDANLAGQGIAVANYTTRIRNFAYLKPDIIVLVPDRVEAREAPAVGMPERSGVYALTGYVPILPIILKEKGRLMQTSGRGRLAAGVGGFLLATGELCEAADSALLSWVADPPAQRAPYGDALALAVKAALESARDVIVVVPPRRSGLENRGPLASDAVPDDLRARVAAEPGGDGNPRVHFVDLEAVTGLRAGPSWLNDMNLGAGGNSQAAGAVAPAVLDLIPR